MKQAEQDYREAIKAGEGEDVVYQSWGNALAHVGRLREAIERYGQAIEWNGENAQCFHNLATVQVRYSGSRPSEESGVLRSASQQNFARAETLYKRKVERENQVAAKVLLNRLYFDWGSALVSVGDKAGARQKLSHVNPGVASNTRGGLSLDLGRQLMILGDLEAAVSRFGEALEADPRNEQAYSALGGAQMRLRRYSEAVTSYRRAIDISNSSRRKAELYLGLGNAYYRSGDDRAAVQAYDKGLEVDPRNRRLLLNCGTVLTMQGELNEALKRLDNLWRLDPERPPPELLVGLGNVYSEFGWREADPGKAKAQFQVALQRYQRALGIATGKELLCSIHNNVAVAQNGLARFDLARDALTSAGAVCPLGDPDLLSTHAEFYGLQGDKEKFAEYLQKALEAGLRVDDRHLELRPYVTYKNDPSIKPMLERLRVAPPRRGP